MLHARQIEQKNLKRSTEDHESSRKETEGILEEIKTISFSKRTPIPDSFIYMGYIQVISDDWFSIDRTVPKWIQVCSRNLIWQQKNGTAVYNIRTSNFFS